MVASRQVNEPGWLRPVGNIDLSLDAEPGRRLGDAVCDKRLDVGERVAGAEPTDYRGESGATRRVEGNADLPGGQLGWGGVRHDTRSLRQPDCRGARLVRHAGIRRAPKGVQQTTSESHEVRVVRNVDDRATESTMVRPASAPEVRTLIAIRWVDMTAVGITAAAASGSHR